MHLCPPPPPPPPKKNLHNHCFQFLLGKTVVIREVQGNGHKIFLFFGWGGGGAKGRGRGVNKVRYGICENGE